MRVAAPVSRRRLGAIAAALTPLLAVPGRADAASAAQIDAKVALALASLYASNAIAKMLAPTAKGDQKGLMAGISVEGSKITKIEPGK